LRTQKALLTWAEAPERFFFWGARNLILVAYLSRALEERKFTRKFAGYLGACHYVINH